MKGVLRYMMSRVESEQQYPIRTILVVVGRHAEKPTGRACRLNTEQRLERDPFGVD